MTNSIIAELLMAEKTVTFKEEQDGSTTKLYVKSKYWSEWVLVRSFVQDCYNELGLKRAIASEARRILSLLGLKLSYTLKHSWE